MKNFTRLFAAAFLFVSCLSLQAQQKNGNPTTVLQKGVNATPQRCGVDQMIQQRLQSDPAFKLRYEEGLRQYQQSLQNSSSRTQTSTTLTNPVIIPVVFHIVLPDPSVVTDGDVLYVLNRMNLDFSGFNPDTANTQGTLFAPLRGHSLIRFALARRDPSGNCTNGIERRVGAGAIGGGNPQPIKSTASGGLDPWPVTDYYNMWIGVGAGGLLGIAPEIGPGNQSGPGVDGVCVDYRAFAHNPCYTLNAFNLGRTIVHEVGHNFGLFHTFQGGCNTLNDFGQLTTASCILPDAFLAGIDDTPAQSGATSGCPSGVAASGCSSPTPPGRMYQSYMDYTDDACYSMFSKGEVDRMHWVLENCRPGYLTSLGATPPASCPVVETATTALVNPGGTALTGTGRYSDPTNTSVWTCTSYPTPTCPTTITPSIRIVNLGSAPLAGVTIGYSNNNGTPVTQTVTFASPLPFLVDTVIAFSTPLTLVANNSLKFWSKSVGDANAANDTVYKVLNFGGAALPLVEGFEGTTFPPTGWTISNPNNNVTWVRDPTHGANSASSASIDNYFNNLPGQIDDLRSSPIGTTGLDSLIISWDLAHKNFPAAGLNDKLEVLVSTNCGATYQVVWTRTDPALATAGSSANPYNGATGPAPSDWINQRVSIGSNVTGWGNPLIVAFRNTNGYGNHLYIDNIRISGFLFTNNDLSAQAVVRPLSNECVNNIIPELTVKNTGLTTVNSFQVGYRLDNGPFITCPTVLNVTIAPNASATVTYPATCGLTNLTPGNHTLRLYTVNPNGSPDLFQANDTIVKVFNVKQLVTSVSENFDASVFPPPTIQINNPNGNVTWVRDVPGRASPGGIEIDNANNNLPGQIDDIQLLPINTTGVDSVILTFDLAHRPWTGFSDILSVVASTNCGNSFVNTTYSKTGSALATAPDLAAAYTTAGPNDWRTERLALGGSFVTSGSLILAIRNTNGYSNFIHIDNINVTRKFKRDLQLVSINVPRSVICTPNNIPSVTVRNVGSETITSYSVAYQIGAGTPSSTAVNTSIAPGASATISLNSGVFPAGTSLFKAWTASPVSASGTGDNNTSNDTLTKSVTLVSTVAPPINEGFESTTFPPTGWAVVNPDNGITWRRTTAAASSGVASAYVNNYNYAANGRVDDLVTPSITYTGVDSVSLKFDVAALTYSYPGSTTIPLDTLEVLATKDCGNTYTTIYKKWGHELQTVSDPNYAQPVEFFPSGKFQWRTESIDLTGIAGGNGPLQLVFRNTTNFENNIFLDNVSVTTRTLPARLKNEGYLVLPSPFANQFTVWHYLQPTEMKYISVYNSAGQLVWRKDFSGDADKQITVDLSNRSAGVYVVHIGYNDPNRNTSVRVVKY